MCFIDVRQTFRRLWNNRGFSSSVVLTLGLGIGATVSVFSVIHAVMIQPLPYASPAQLVSVFQSKMASDEEDIDTSAPANFLDFRARNHVFTDLAAYCTFHYNLTGKGDPEELNGTAISASLFSILGVQPALGRNFLPSEDSYSSPHVVILSEPLWSGTFHRDPNVVGKSISLNGDPYYVVGVMPAGFSSPGDDGASALWIPLQQQIRPDRMLGRDQRYLGVVVRLRSSVNLDQARADINRIAAQLHAEYPAANMGSGAVVMPLQQALVGKTSRSLLLSLGIVVFVLLIASCNVAILMLARVNGRTRELGIRIALGANSSQILCDVVTESVILGLASGGLGIFLALLGRKLFLYLAPDNGYFGLIGINPAVLAFAVAVSIMVGIFFGLLPALTVVRTDIQRVLRKAGNASATDAAGRFLRHALVIGEISLSIVLLIGTGLLLRSMLHLQNQPLGFRTDRVVAVWVGLPRIRYQNNNDVINFFTRVDENLRALPAYEAVGLGYRLPLGGDQFWTDFTIAGRDTVAGEYDSAALRFIDSGFLRVMDTHLLEGRNFSDADDVNAQPVTIVSESFARKYWPGDDAIGKYISILRDTSVPRRAVGVVADAKATIEDDPPPTIYVSYKQMSFPSMQIVLLQRDRSASAIADVRRAVQSVDPLQPVQDSQSMESMVRASLDPSRFALSLLGGLAGLAVLLTTVGLFAVVSYLVRERTRELGIRMAIGAPRSSIMRLVLGQSLKLALFGTSVGLVFTFAVVRLMSSMVYAIRPNDPITFVIVAMSVAAISILAAFIPAYRAARVEPLAALREE